MLSPPKFPTRWGNIWENSHKEKEINMRTSTIFPNDGRYI